MRSTLRTILGFALIITAAGGLVASLFGLYSVWRYKTPASDSLQENLDLVGRALDAAEEGLISANSSLDTSIESMRALHDTLDTTAEIVDASVPMIDSMTQLAQTDLPNMVENAQTSLEAAQESARIVDAVLTAVTRIPFVPQDIYNPPVPLHIALQQVSDSMEPLPDTLNTIETSMASTADNLKSVKGEIDLMADDVFQIRRELEGVQRITSDYRSLISSVQERVGGLERRLPVLLNLAAWALTFLFLWFIMVQLALFVLGWDLVKGRR